MGRSTSSDVVPFVAHAVYYCGHMEIPDKEPFKTLETEQEDACETDDDLLQHPIGEWVWVANADAYGKRKRLYVDTLKKGDHTIHVINVSEFVCIGAVVSSVCADDKESIEAFLEDFELEGTIEEMDSVEQTI